MLPVKSFAIPGTLVIALQLIQCWFHHACSRCWGNHRATSCTSLQSSHAHSPDPEEPKRHKRH